MAVVARVTVRPADQAVHDAVEEAVGSALDAAGGPPDGLMVHVASPRGDGFEILEVWRTEATWSAWWLGVLEPLFAGMGLEPTTPELTPVWSFARP